MEIEKIGGVNSAVPDPLPKFNDDVATIIFGADVSHPSPIDKARPSIAALSSSMDKFATLHLSVVRAQGH